MCIVLVMFTLLAVLAFLCLTRQFASSTTPPVHRPAALAHVQPPTMSMKMITFASLALAAVASSSAVATATQDAMMSMPTPEEAMLATQNIEMPSGVSFTGTTEMLQPPADVAKESAGDDKKEYLWGGVGGWGGLHGGWGGFGGFGGFGPYRFGFTCGGLSGWAYPLSFWNTWGAGIYGGGCGLGIPSGGLFFC